ncbi:hypothetical protein BDZ45DRAFT_726925 [Acephala macrosclerotiorum]|nr:hypothetical protein BDZ45DRAFT_726925 [Acephala macrosclerotiorum]
MSFFLDTSTIRRRADHHERKAKRKGALKAARNSLREIYLPDQFPTHLLNTFRRIRSFRRVDFSSFSSSDPSVPPERVLWRSEITNRAREIVAIAATLIEDATVEMEVRLRLEQKVLRRFNMIIECPSAACQKRLWRSEVEAEVEFPDRIAKSLATRRPDRSPCQCPPEERSSYLNKIFSSRADEMTSFDSFETDSEESIKRRRPDRILGFQETGSFSRRLEKYNLMAGRSENEAGLETIWETVESTVLNHKGNSLLFPFLIVEAKSRNGASFEDCDAQTALPVLKMLKIQEDLQRKSQMTLEYGGPLVWYIAYRGEDWRLSGCYISEKPGGPSYASPIPTVVCDIANIYQEIVTLWTGQLNDVESTLQLLLIIDYIFDWARDIYKPSIISQLEMLANEPSEDDGDIRDDDFTRIDTDSDIFSLARPKQPRAIEDWGAALEHDTEMVPDEERSLMEWATHDSDFGVFRPACTVQNLFRCLFVTKANIDALFAAVPKRCTVKQLAKQATSALDTHRTVLVSEDVLDMIEEV